jgi:hypothetical protein
MIERAAVKRSMKKDTTAFGRVLEKTADYFAEHGLIWLFNLLTRRWLRLFLYPSLGDALRPSVSFKT